MLEWSKEPENMFLKFSVSSGFGWRTTGNVKVCQKILFNANLGELMQKDRQIDMAELDKAWTAANPETWSDQQESFLDRTRKYMLPHYLIPVFSIIDFPILNNPVLRPVEYL